MTACVVPLKNLTYAKQRLAGLLQPDERRRICIAMLFDVIGGLRKVPEIEDIHVLTPDPEVERSVRTRYPDVKIMPDPGTGGLNNALTNAVRTLKQEGVSRLLIIPADLPMLDPDDISSILKSTRGIAMGIAHDEAGEGTNLLFLSPPSIMDPRFGPRSFAEHVAQARRMGISCRIFSAPSLLCDVDEPRDVRVLLSHGTGTEACCNLVELRIDERMSSPASR